MTWRTRLTWTGANVTMAAWLHEQNGRRFSHAALINTCNAVMCLATLALILVLRR